jgi:hypothetical protein
MPTLALAVFLLLLAASLAHADDAVRYGDIRRLINANRHLSGHLVMAVDARTIKAVRSRISEADLPVLVRMMGDKDYGVASAASGLAATLGEAARPALVEAAHGRDAAIAAQARDALSLLDACVTDEARGTMNPDVCPAAKAR